jgi:two-component system sensor histidine kinase/response regulator
VGRLPRATRFRGGRGGERIFDKYVQLEAGAQVRTGPGLGLVFCRLAVEAHGGRIWVEAGAPTGSVFCVRLPVA